MAEWSPENEINKGKVTLWDYAMDKAALRELRKQQAIEKTETK